MNHDPVKQAWQASVEIGGAPPLEDVRKGADKFYRFVKWRNLIEYAACVVVIVGFGTYVFTLPHLLQKLGSGLILLATLYVAWQLHRRAAAVSPDRAGMIPIVEFMRIQLIRQRDALRAVFWWYILPFVPGFLIMVAGNAGAAANTPTVLVPLRLGDWLFLAGFAGLLFFIWRFNQRVADKLQKQLDEIDSLTGRTE